MSKDSWQRTTSTPEEEAGLLGERILLSVLEKIPGGYAAGPLYFPTKSGGITETDAILLHPSGLYVFENKEYSGTLSGAFSDRLWMKTNSFGQTFSVSNPIAQNSMHTKAAAAALRIPEKYVHSVIVFANACDISRIPQNRTDCCITQISRLKAALQEQFAGAVFSKEEVEALAGRLAKFRGSEKAAQKHAKHIAEIKKERKAEKKRGR
ncbi:MAG TPA: nuclease-related domain-containing protein [Methanocorpusculum sp.]|nr:nuclease-related domain-containing protein [Methanocorpusculum sp.]